MTTPTMILDCDGFAAALADYLEGDAPEGLRAAVEAHASSCPACSALLSDLTTITADASALPLLTPSRDLWSGIAARIDAPVISLDTTRATRDIPRRPQWLRPAIAAAALVVVTAGITYKLTRASLVTADPTKQVAGVPQKAAPAPVDPNATIKSTLTEASVSNPTRAAESAPKNPSEERPAAQLASVTRHGGDPADPVFASEITKLRRIVRERRDMLDPKTVAVLEQSIAVIDSAIAQSRAALAKDPASAFLATQLNHSLEKKVELLRTAALLPART